MNTMTNARLAPLNLSGPKAMFLFCIFDHKTMSQAEICHELDMDKSSVAKMLVRLEKDGLITKTVNPNDIRSFLVSLTDQASAMIPEARKITDNWVDDATNCLTDLEKRNFYELLDKVVDNISCFEK